MEAGRQCTIWHRVGHLYFLKWDIWHKIEYIYIFFFVFKISLNVFFCISAFIRIGQDIWCLLYSAFSLIYFFKIVFETFLFNLFWLFWYQCSTTICTCQKYQCWRYAEMLAIKNTALSVGANSIPSLYKWIDHFWCNMGSFIE